MKELSEQQKVQESEYSFPYHYLDLQVQKQLYLGSTFGYLARMQEIKKRLQPLKGKVILDAGCGEGRFCYEMRDESCTMVGVDYSARAIAFAKAFNPEVEFHVQGLEEMDINRKFDAIVLQETLEHIIPEEIPNLMKNIAKILKPGGKFIITVPSVNIPVASKHYQHFSPESLENAVKPYFRKLSIDGLSKLGWPARRYELMKKLAFILYPLRNKFAFAKKYLASMNDYYLKSVSSGTPAECGGLIGVFELNK